MSRQCCLASGQATASPVFWTEGALSAVAFTFAFFLTSTLAEQVTANTTASIVTPIRFIAHSFQTEMPASIP
jgi:hypothetical protein